jgi:hypothetical protein
MCRSRATLIDWLQEVHAEALPRLRHESSEQAQGQPRAETGRAQRG